MDLERILAPIKDDLSDFDQKLKDYISSDSPLIYQIASHLLSAKGKRLRPAMVYLTGGAFGKNGENFTKTALSIELIHNATLLHDDVIDQSDTRRGKPTVSTKWNNLVAVLMGDYLFAKAFKIMMETQSQPLLSAISRATERVSLGELLEVQERSNFELDEKSYLEIIKEKTASLFSVSCEAGVILSQTKGNHRKNLKDYGENFGISFQIADDLLDYVGTKIKTGKEKGNDLREGKITLPLIYALKKTKRNTKESILQILEKNVDHDGFLKVLEFVDKEGGLKYAQSKASEFGEKALRNILKIEDSEYKKSMSLLAEFSIKRDK
ncbi:MAG: hypothetical protein AMJ90_08810 [candidate division Zixibacteria bacterium SM23_73_2]|nr:MAG: hypothetical protein AMJ90_08810 [candidate division Zixibacteria bacterium SM23_73_2]